MFTKKMKDNIKDGNIRKTTFTSFILIGIAIFGFIIIFIQLLFLDKKPENFGVIGDAVGGILNPIIALAAALLTFLAFYIQKQANEDIRKQFLEQSYKENDDFLYKKYSDKITLLNNEINGFFCTFLYKSDVYTKSNKKRNFNGIQAIIATFNIYSEMSEDNINDKIQINAKMHEIYSIFAFYHKNLNEIQNLCFSKENIQINKYGILLKKDLIDNMIFIYNSKLKYLIENNNTKLKEKKDFKIFFNDIETLVDKMTVKKTENSSK